MNYSFCVFFDPFYPLPFSSESTMQYDARLHGAVHYSYSCYQEIDQTPDQYTT